MGIFSKVVNNYRYNSMVKAKEQYNNMMQSPLNAENAKSMNKLQEKLRKRSEKYLKSAEKLDNHESRAKYSVVKQINDFAKSDFINTDKVKSAQREGGKMADVFNEPIDITNKEKKEYGAGASRRVRFEHEGKVGFFTPSNRSVKCNNYGDIDDEKYKEIVADKNSQLEKSDKALYEKMESNRLINNSDLRGLMLEGKTTSQAINNIAMTARVDVTNFTEAELKKVENYYRDLDKITTAANVMAADAQISEDKEMSSRNTATSSMANMLGVNDKIAVSKNIKVVENGVETEGCFMEQAKGIDSRSHEGLEFFANNEFDFSAPSLQRDINRMQVLDMVCGQVDRHGGNFFYQVGETPVNGKYQITGLQGIDNDMAFGKIKLDNTGKKRLPPIDTLTMIDEDMLNSLRELTPDKLKLNLNGMLDEEEIAAIQDRKNAILDRVDKNQTKVIKSNEWGEKTFEDTKKSPYYKEIENEITTADKEVERRKKEEFEEYDAQVKRIDKYNAKHPDSKQQYPQGPEDYSKEKMNSIDDEMKDYEQKVEKMVKEGVPANKLPKPPKGYNDYKEAMNLADKEVSIDELFDKKVATTPIKKAASNEKSKAPVGLDKK